MQLALVYGRAMTVVWKAAYGPALMLPRQAANRSASELAENSTRRLAAAGCATVILSV